MCVKNARRTRYRSIGEGNNFDDDNRNPAQAVGEDDAEEARRQHGILSLSADKDGPSVLTIALDDPEHADVKDDNNQNLSKRNGKTLNK